MLKDLIEHNRSCRRFREDQRIGNEVLWELVNLARLSASSGNLQPLKYVLSTNAEANQKIFDCLAWAAYLSDWNGPVEGERPAAYIIVLGDKDISHPVGCDHGIAAQSITLGATERGLAACILGSIKRDQLKEFLNLPNQYHILLVIALGKPAEEIKLETVGPDGSIRYWRDETGVHHVPKRSLDEIVVKAYE